MNINYLLKLSNPEYYDRLIPASERVVPLELPEMELGDFTITKRTFEKEERLEMTMFGGYVRYDDEIVVTMLHQNGSIWMSDSPSELRDMANLIGKATAHGTVLVAGLGMGLLTAMLMDEPEVERIDVVELNQEVITFIKPYVQEKAEQTGKTLNIINADAFEFVRENTLQAYDCCILDIWGNVSSDDLDPMILLWKLIQDKKKMDGAVWGIDMAVEGLMQEVRGYEYPEDMAYEIESNYGMGAICDYILEYYPNDHFTETDEDGEYMEEWSDYEEDAITDAFFHVYNLDIR